jgi:peptidyl-tRNA hydrolase, PTH1 family
MIGEMTINGEKILTLKPLSYMNRSGAAIKSASSYYKIPVSDILVLHDEIDREFGRI